MASNHMLIGGLCFKLNLGLWLATRCRSEIFEPDETFQVIKGHLASSKRLLTPVYSFGRRLRVVLYLDISRYVRGLKYPSFASFQHQLCRRRTLHLLL